MSESKNETSTICAVLEYDWKWIDYGFMDESDLQKQYERFTHSRDECNEHYRYASFLAFLSRHSILSDEMINNFIELATIDEDQSMATAALAELLRFKGLSGSQFEFLCNHKMYKSLPLQKLVKKKTLINELDHKEEISDAAFEKYLASNDSDVQIRLLYHSGIKKTQLQILQQSGCNKTVRNLVKEKLNQRKWR
jgi:hypothetical protein